MFVDLLLANDTADAVKLIRISVKCPKPSLDDAEGFYFLYDFEGDAANFIIKETTLRAGSFGYDNKHEEIVLYKARFADFGEHRLLAERHGR